MTVAWHDDQKRLTPDQVQSVAFPTSRLGRRGYDEEHVRGFLGLVERELVLLMNEKVSLWNEVERLRRRIISGASASEGVLFGREDAHVHAVRILSNAQLTADRYVADAQAYSQRLTEDARSRRDEILAEAQGHADLVLEEASARAREAAVAALDAPPSPHLEADRRTLQAELAYLRAFGEVYRTHLRAYTEGMLRSIEEWERKESLSLRQKSAEMAGPAGPAGRAGAADPAGPSWPGVRPRPAAPGQAGQAGQAGPRPTPPRTPPGQAARGPVSPGQAPPTTAGPHGQVPPTPTVRPFIPPPAPPVPPGPRVPPSPPSPPAAPGPPEPGR